MALKDLLNELIMASCASGFSDLLWEVDLGLNVMSSFSFDLSDQLNYKISNLSIHEYLV